MKKWFAAVLAALLALSMAAFAACDSGETPGGGDGGDGGDGETTSYTVTAAESDLYDIGGQTRKATAGTAAYVTVTPEYEAVSITAVYYNGQPCTKDAENADRYNFTMPAEDVTITVDVAFTDRAEDDNFLAWDTANETTVLTGTGTAELAFTTDWSNTSATRKEVLLSSDQNVIPNEALSIDYSTSGSLIEGGTIKIDRSKIHTGKAQIVLALQSSNVTTYDGCIVCTVTVEEEPEITHVDTWTETVVFTANLLRGDIETLAISFTDLDHQEYTDTTETQSFFHPNNPNGGVKFAIDDNKKITVTIEYVPEHEYSITLYYGGTAGPEIYMKTGGEGKWSRDVLTFDNDGTSIEFRLTD